jgi:hypothetical protein
VLFTYLQVIVMGKLKVTPLDVKVEGVHVVPVVVKQDP